jgi:hypothetical protein
MCLCLIRSRFFPTLLGPLGFAGYLCLIAATTASAFGSEMASMALLLPDCEFEVIFDHILALRGHGVRMPTLSR